MNYATLFTATCFFLIACNNKSDQQKAQEDTTAVATNYSWSAELNDSSGRLQMKKIPTGPDSLTIASVIDYLNRSNPNIKLVLSKTSNDTVYINIPEPTYLTQQMGSTGPTMYLASVIYNLTEVQGFRYVTLDFEEGDHAGPGTYNRDSFKDE